MFVLRVTAVVLEASKPFPTRFFFSNRACSPYLFIRDHTPSDAHSWDESLRLMFTVNAFCWQEINIFNKIHSRFLLYLRQICFNPLRSMHFGNTLVVMFKMIVFSFLIFKMTTEINLCEFALCHYYNLISHHIFNTFSIYILYLPPTVIY